jgi:diguanylate cyclase (GGDEF)-like protein
VTIAAAELGGPLRIVALVEQTRQLAMTDSLTGLLNRRAFGDALARALAVFDRYGDALSILLLDVDHFKRVNDTRGHDAGDAVLVGIATALRAAARRTDFVARWGGEEFILGLTHTPSAATAAGPMIAAERVRRAIMDRPFELPGGQTISVTVSVGVSRARRGDTEAEVIARADAALYRAKSLGRNRCEASDDDRC